MARATADEVDILDEVGPVRDSVPTAVKILVVLGILQAIVLAGVGVSLVAGRSNAALQDGFDATAASLAAGGVAVAVVGVITGALAVALGRGKEWARSFFGALNTVEVAAAVFALVGQRNLRFDSVWALALPVMVLWLLYGPSSSQEYFRR